MPVEITPDQIALLAPSARSSYRAAFASGRPALDHYAVSDSPLRVAHFMAQVLHESGGLTVQFENLNYSAARLPKVWPKRFRPTGPLDPAGYAYNPQKLANEVYGGRMGNRAPDDGFRYRGRGLLQLTGKDGYTETAAFLRRDFPNAPDFAADPDLVLSAEWGLHAAAAVWAMKGCNALADGDSIHAVTRAINGGLIGIADRTEWLRRTKFVWP